LKRTNSFEAYYRKDRKETKEMGKAEIEDRGTEDRERRLYCKKQEEWVLSIFLVLSFKK